ncbi:MAG TPA: serine/threonine-protein kinase [Thermoanaerobaculia bacterium]|nr:serine/threonine-protein kinase [Thermoanaerobaculia bacterium]
MRSSDYEFRDRLGEGWAGVTWHAALRVSKFGLSPGASVAVKLYKPEIFGQAPHIKERIEREASIGELIEHVNVLRVFALEEIDIEALGPRLALIMEFCHGGDLHHVLYKSSGAADLDIGRFARGLIAGLGRIHQSGIVHRDIKPHNILVSVDGTPRIADFGVVRHVDETTMTNTSEFLGTIRYSAPEVLEGSPPTFASDVYSLGTVLYELIYGAPVFAGIEMFAALIANIVRSAVSWPEGPTRFGDASINLNVLLLEAFCRRMLSRSPSERPSADTLAQWIDEGLAAAPIRDELFEAVHSMLKEHERRWFREAGKDRSVFTDFRAAWLVSQLSEEDACALLLSPDPGLIEQTPRYLEIATSYLPADEEYLALPQPLRLAVANSLRAQQRPLVFEIWDEPLTQEDRDYSYMRLVEGYQRIETDSDIKPVLERIRPLKHSDY